jgi:5-methylcytosine-specific restriction endonuclease McrA
MCVRADETERRAFHAERHTKAKLFDPAKYFKKANAKRFNKDWAKMRAQVFALKGSKCEYCGDDASHVDHKRPRSRGGKDDIDNLAPCCVACNMSKGTMTVEEWRR